MTPYKMINEINHYVMFQFDTNIELPDILKEKWNHLNSTLKDSDLTCFNTWKQQNRYDCQSVFQLITQLFKNSDQDIKEQLYSFSRQYSKTLRYLYLKLLNVLTISYIETSIENNSMTDYLNLYIFNSINKLFEDVLDINCIDCIREIILRITNITIKNQLSDLDDYLSIVKIVCNLFGIQDSALFYFEKRIQTMNSSTVYNFT